MPVPTHFKFVVRGIFNGTPEQWSTSAHYTRNHDLGTDAGLDDIRADDVTDAVVAYWGSINFGNQIEVSDWRFYDIGTDGHMEGNAPLMHTFEPRELHGAGTAWQYPPQLALVMTLMAEERGPAQFGRQYLPLPAVTVDSSGRVSQAQAAGQRDEFTAYTKAISDCIDLVGVVSSSGCNVSKGPVGSGTGTLQLIDHIETGRVIDTLRNRRKSLDEDRDVGGHIDW